MSIAADDEKFHISFFLAQSLNHVTIQTFIHSVTIHNHLYILGLSISHLLYYRYLAE